jgi:hypothetical protein
MKVIGTCEQCGQPFRYTPGKQTGRWCSRSCLGKDKRTPLDVRFFAKVQKTDGCWVWIGSASPLGYGRINVDGVPRIAPRISWQLHNGDIPDGMSVCHRCDNPRCVNPDHLFLATHSGNMQDMVSKNRHAAKTRPERYARGDRHGSHTHPERWRRGETSPAAKLSDADVERIRHRYATEQCSLTSLGKEFGVSRTHIRRLISGNSRPKPS